MADSITVLKEYLVSLPVSVAHCHSYGFQYERSNSAMALALTVPRKLLGIFNKVKVGQISRLAYFVSGIYTGSVYKDYGLLKNGFPAESVVNGSVSVVKTHEWGAAGRQRFQRAVLLIRAPGPAILAEFNRQSGGHVGFASPERYRRNKGRCKLLHVS